MINKQYDVEIRRTEYRTRTFRVEASCAAEAWEKGQNESFDSDFAESPVHHADEEVISIRQVSNEKEELL